jgi:molybdenum cofactor biosynthesis enzyme MoaA
MATTEETLAGLIKQAIMEVKNTRSRSAIKLTANGASLDVLYSTAGNSFLPMIKIYLDIPKGKSFQGITAKGWDYREIMAEIEARETNGDRLDEVSLGAARAVMSGKRAVFKKKFGTRRIKRGPTDF